MSRAALDHLVVLAHTLDEGVAWCEATLGVTPSAGGAHPLMGTHNRLLRLRSASGQPAYLEILAVDPGQTPQRTAPLKRWFDLDQPALQARLRQHGPSLQHWVARCPDVQGAGRAWQALGLERGPVLTASRQTAHGLLSWQITVRDDGQRLLDGTLPTLIQWGDQHPVDQLPDAGLELLDFRLSLPDPAPLDAALQALALPVPVHAGPPQLQATLLSPRGRVTLQSLT
ncbi:VOC family protein [Curvibacter sp. HBC61]|uniref:VOC family protein n=1 Tax=Curvibacter cyanobacteriorum TaxID=3026422 RepID=A0ABT5N4Y6_9BURK|nr:VOC family protein [Curvibacter sp. HBC61]MDD0840157.1 VOC family protein [Curvibacter sp. HBC61]